MISALFLAAHIEGTHLISEYTENQCEELTENSPNLVDHLLRETRGIILFQEQIMLLLNRLGGISLSNAYDFIKRVSKRDYSLVPSYRSQFRHNVKQYCCERKAVELFDQVAVAGKVAVCKSHYLANALTAYQITFLKAHFPDKFRVAARQAELPI